MMLRRIMIVTSSLLLVLAGAACGGSTPTPVAQQAPATAVPQTRPPQPATTVTTPLPPMPPTFTSLPPTATAIPPSPTPTVPPLPPVPVPAEAQTHFQKAVELYKLAAQSQKFQPSIDELVQGIQIFLASLPRGAESIKAPGTADGLTKQLEAFGQMAKPAVVVGNFFSETQPAVAISTGGLGLPALLFQATKADKPVQPGDYKSYILPPPAADQHDLGPMVNTAQKMGDLNKDGLFELFLTSQIPGASAVTTVLHIYQAEGTGIKEIFDTSINNGAGGGDWKLLQLPNGAYSIVATCAAFGVFDQKLLPHPIETITYQWIDRKYIVYSRTQEKPATGRQQVNVAEQAFIEGRHRDSMDAYLKATNDTNLRQEPETNQIDWRNMANLRVGMILAINGNESRARSFLENATQQNDIFGQIATKFLHEYKSAADAPHAWGAVSNLPLRQEAFQKKIPLDPTWVDQLIHPIYAAVGLLNLGRQQIGGPDQFKKILQDDGLDVTDLQVGDMEGDGNPEVIVALNIVGPNELNGPTGKKAEVWMLTRTRQGWRAINLEAKMDQGGTVKIRSLNSIKGVQDQSAVVLEYPSNGKTVERVVGWDGSNLVNYKDATSFERVLAASTPVQCIAR